MHFSLRILPLLLCAVAYAQEGEPLPPPPLPAPAPEGIPEEELELGPQVTIIQRDEVLIQEYRMGGQLYMVKIVPARGVPYYLIDTDGDGNLETRRFELAGPEVPQWPILQW